MHLTHWGRMMHICVSKLTIIGLDNGLSPGRRQAIIWTNAEMSLIRNLGSNVCEILSEIHNLPQENPVQNVICEMAVISSQPQCVKTLRQIMDKRLFHDHKMLWSVYNYLFVCQNTEIYSLYIFSTMKRHMHPQTSNKKCTLLGSKIVDLVGASPAGTAPTRSSFLT